MKKMILRVLAAIGLLFSVGMSATAQMPGQIPTLPLDSAVVYGKLDNGLTYYIRHNNNPKGQADFFIAQKVGSVLEEDNQRGLAHFLEHMCFNGTTNFPDKQIINWLGSVGVRFGYNLNAYTGVDETVYNISSVPVARTSVQDSCLLILHDWSCDLTLAPEEINAERGVIHEEWRSNNKGSMRILEQLLPKIYDGSRYGERLPIGTMEVVDNFPPQALVDYYHTWYRPDQQAVIVVGDIDPAYIEAKIKEIFDPIKMPENAKERQYFPVDDNKGTIYAIGKDTEMEMAAVDMFFKNDNLFLPVEYRNTPVFYQVQYMYRMASNMLNNRLGEISMKPDAKFASARISIGDFFLSKTKSALDLEVVGKGNDVIPAFEQAYRELIRAARTGFTLGEYERARAEFLSYIEKQYEGRKDKDNTSYAREYVRTFVDNHPAPGIATDKEIYDAIAGQINVGMINQFFSQIITQDNRVLLAMLPDRDGFRIPAEEDFAKLTAAVEAEDLEAYRDEMRTDPLIPSLPAPGKVKSSKKLAEWDATEYTLSNGVKVIVKPTTFKNNEIVFEAVATGKAMSTLPASDAATVRFSKYGIMSHGLNDYTSTDLQKYLQGKQASVTFDFDNYTRSLSGTSTVKDLGTLMEFIYCWFTGFNISEDDFASTQHAVLAQLANAETTPDFIFGSKLREVLFKAPAKGEVSSETVNAADRARTVGIVRDMLANAADFTFVFTGNIDTATFIPMLEQYIATLPANAKKATRNYSADPDFEIALGNESSIFTTPMQTPQAWIAIAFSANMPYTAKNKALASIASQILSKELLNKVREEMGATYSIGCYGSMGRTGNNNTAFQIVFPMKPEMEKEALAAIKEIIEATAKKVTPEQLNPVKEYMVKSALEGLEENDDWAGAISATTINGVQTFTNSVETINAITPADVEAYLTAVIAQDNYRTIILNPAE